MAETTINAGFSNSGFLNRRESVVMFASRNHNQAKAPEGRRPERGDSKPDRKTSSEQNPLWQSLAMRSGALQTKLIIGQADDPYEREADRVADQLMRMSAPQSEGRGLSITPVTAHQAQRKCAECEEEEEDGALRRKESGSAEAPATVPSIVHETLSSPGRPLDTATRAYFEPRFGEDFSRVRIHTDTKAVESARAVNALAYTTGLDVVFGTGQYAPSAHHGRRLLAHELAHVVQQKSEAKSVIQCARWFHGQGIDVPRSTYPEVIHDLGNGLYLTDRVNVGAHYAYSRSPEREEQASGIRLSFVEIAESGHFLNLAQTEEWQAYVADLVELTGMSERNLIWANEKYWGHFLNFLAQNDPVALNQAESTGQIQSYRGRPIKGVIGPEYLNGSFQMVIYDTDLERDVLNRMRPVIADLPSEMIGTEGKGGYAVGTKTKILSYQANDAGVMVELDISLPDQPSNATQSTETQALADRMVARLQIDARGTVVAIEVLEGPPAIVAPLARQIAANSSPLLYGPNSPSPSSGGSGSGGDSPTQKQLPVLSPGKQLPVVWQPPKIASPGKELPQIAPIQPPAPTAHGLPRGLPEWQWPPGTPSGSQLTASGVKQNATSRPLSGEAGAAAGLGGAMVVESAAREWANYVTSLETEEAQQSVAAFMPDISRELEKNREMGAIIMVSFSQPLQPGYPATFLGASPTLVSGLTLAEARESYRRQGGLLAEPTCGEIITRNYWWVPPLNSAETEAHWSEPDLCESPWIEGLMQSWEQLWERLAPGMFREG